MEIMAPLEQGADVKAPRAEVRGAHWLKPKLVAEIAYTEMTNEGTLRHPSYLGLREDKKPEAVVLEKSSAGRGGYGCAAAPASGSATATA
jgi:bifunctional non-homologous end joining protein LigD